MGPNDRSDPDGDRNQRAGSAGDDGPAESQPTEPVTAGHGSPPAVSESELFSFRMSGISPAKSAAPASRKPSGAA